VAQGCDGTGLALEPLQAAGLPATSPGMTFMATSRPRRGSHAVDHAHPAFTELFCDLIMAERLADYE
jgi:hypothetical protein